MLLKWNDGGGIVSQMDEAEYSRLADQVRDIERVLLSTDSGDVGLLLKSFLHNAKSRMEEISHVEIKDIESDKERKMTNIAQAVQLAEMEHKLSVTEKRQYAEFLQQDYFTKANFEGLEEFYAQSWDKLSERGKNEMSQRVWEGIKQQEYTFDELPEIVRKKESERLYLQLTGAIEPTEVLENIPPQARVDFVREYEARNEVAAAKVLSLGGAVNQAAAPTKQTALDTAAPSQNHQAETMTTAIEASSKQNMDVDLSCLSFDEGGSVPATSLAAGDPKTVEKL